jgi:hypothetical protein
MHHPTASERVVADGDLPRQEHIARERMTPMSLPKSGDDGNMITDRAQFDLTLEIADSERQRPWPSGI